MIKIIKFITEIQTTSCSEYVYINVQGGTIQL